MDSKYTLTHGIHRGTITSRDTGQPEHFDTEAEAFAQLDGHRKFYRSVGYVIWFANITAPDGTKIHSEGNGNYR